uniref:Uncharacterized protein n=1 Tax=Anguilla anguilla TaxID=7936 RepID=A0A0E9T0L4_ANGAN
MSVDNHNAYQRKRHPKTFVLKLGIYNSSYIGLL